MKKMTEREGVPCWASQTKMACQRKAIYACCKAPACWEHMAGVYPKCQTCAEPCSHARCFWCGSEFKMKYFFQ